jgi:hypothetical protein
VKKELRMYMLKDFYIGQIDAKNEILKIRDLNEIERYKRNYIIPPNVVIERFLNYDKYYITGMKGVGKTALLRYLSILFAEKKYGASVVFV